MAEPTQPGGQAVAAATTSDFPFTVSVGQIYDGPLDLLLDLIRKQDIDIYDIPIGKITAQFLTYVEGIKQLDVDVARSFQQVLVRARSKPVLELDEESVTVGQMIEYIRRRLLLEERPIRLKLLLQHAQSQRALVCAFLALLELVRLQAILLRQDRLFGDILIKKNSNFDAVFSEGEAAVRDDWS